jgi:hypothetical protein
MRVWWSEKQDRLESERANINALLEGNDWLHNVDWSFDDQFNLQVVFEIRLPQGVFPLCLIYHNTFPNTCPSVRPLDSERLSSHQYGKKDLCLEIRPDNWLPSFTGAMMIESAFNLLCIEQPAEDGSVITANSAHNVSSNIVSRNAIRRFYLPQHQIEALSESPNTFKGKLWLKWCGEGFVIGHLKEGVAKNWLFKDDSLPVALGDDSSSQECVVIKNKTQLSLLNSISTKEQLFSAFGTDELCDQNTLWYLVFPEEGYPILYHLSDDSDKLNIFHSIVAPVDTFSRNGEIPTLLGLLRVGIVGLGSLGSKIAVSLARSGMRNFELIDDDIIHSGNLERHDCDWRDVGLHKVNAVARRIKLISNTANVSVRRVSIGAQVSPSEMATVNGALNGCDVIIDATSDPSVLNHLSAISLSSGNTLIWGAVYAGGIGGYMARSRENYEPKPHDIRQALNEYYEGIDNPPPVASGLGYDGQIRDQVFIATDSEVSLMAAHLSNFTLDTLLKKDPSEFDCPVYLLGFKRSWIFESAFHIQPINVDAPIRSRDDKVVNNVKQSEFVEEMIKKKVNEINNRSEVN